MATDYIIRLKCPYGDRDQLMKLENREEPLNQILEMPWDFECPTHGVQREIPVEGSQKSLWPRLRSQRREVKPVGRRAPQPRSSKRISLHVPILVYGWSKDEGSFQEDTRTLLVNASGGLLGLNSRVALGDTIFILNKATQQEQECRVVYVERDVYGKLRVGAAFKSSVPQFWRINRRESRISKKVRVKVLGVDRDGHPFVQNTYATDISRRGARLEGIGYFILPGETIRVKRHLRSAHFRVVWIGEVGAPEAGHAGIFALEPNKNIWGVPLP
jgi:hypothetical protein